MCVCKTCGKEYPAKNYREGRTKYCSYKCAYEGARKPRIEKTCLTCGKVFPVIKGNKWRKDARYCSLDCYYANNTGKNHWNYQHGYGKAGTPEQRKERSKKTYLKHHKKHYNDSRYRRLKQKYGELLEGFHTHVEWEELLQKHGYKCCYCGNTLTEEEGPNKAARDHKIPVMRGGNDNISNIVPSCKSCNSSKGNMTADEYMAFLQRVTN